VVQAVQLLAFDVTLNVPLAHAKQVRSAVAFPSLPTRVPATQFDFATQSVAELPSLSQVTPAQSILPLSPPAQYVPAPHASQTVGELEVPNEVFSVPAAHAPCATQLDWLALPVYVPSAHGEHTRLTVVDAVLLTYVPGSHVAHPSQAVELSAVLKVPLAHGRHVRFCKVLPAVSTCSPAIHVCQAVQFGTLGEVLKVPVSQLEHVRF
jgi:hypothetical protein